MIMQNECFYAYIISMCLCGLNQGRNLHVKLLLCGCCPSHDAHDDFENMSSSTSTSKFSAGNGHSFPSTIKSSPLAPVC